ncbi:hypothetical protein HMPREF0083_02040 [Aneurinibacillus aneurinilyticus ATCC 12856]|uniref:Uncharacterized protein n=1 Tax=Aneurinibacillus aneurinilyticus ATCC 12856 TaxID=649747 RepID=U1YGG6_ANEAE|nr:hypothetical protein HMPREF0083_02040 [Aneurinibacillus aneurinilyticus ATCC 12856]
MYPIRCIYQDNKLYLFKQESFKYDSLIFPAFPLPVKIRWLINHQNRMNNIYTKMVDMMSIDETTYHDICMISHGSHMPYHGIYTISRDGHMPYHGIYTISRDSHMPYHGIYMTSRDSHMPYHDIYMTSRDSHMPYHGIYTISRDGHMPYHGIYTISHGNHMPYHDIYMISRDSHMLYHDIYMIHHDNDYFCLYNSCLNSCYREACVHENCSYPYNRTEKHKTF